MDYKENKDYQAIEATIASLERQLKDLSQVPLQDFSGMKQQVEEHFQSCIKALVDRQNNLVSKLEELSQKQATILSKTKEDISVCIDGCKDMQAAGLRAFKKNPSIAAQLWKGALSLELPPDADIDDLKLRVEIDLPTALLQAIRTHGSINTSISKHDEYDLLKNRSIAISYSDIDNSIAVNISEKISNVLDSATDLEGYGNLESLDSSSTSSVSTSTSSRTSTSAPLALTQSDLSPALPLGTLRDNFSDVDKVTTFAGSIKGATDGYKKEAQFDFPWGICFNPNDEYFYICDSYNHAIRKMTLQGHVSTLAQLTYGVQEIAVYHAKNKFYATYSHCILEIAPTGKVEVFAGGIASPGREDGVGDTSSFNFPVGITIDQKTGNIFVCDSSNDLIRMVTQKGKVSTLAGSSRGYNDANGTKAQFNYPCGICFNEADRSLLVCDKRNNQIRRVSSTGDVVTVCGVKSPHSIAITAEGILLTASNKLFHLAKKGEKYELKEKAGSGTQATIDGSAKECSLNEPRCIAMHEPSKSCFITEPLSNVIRKIVFK